MNDHNCKNYFTDGGDTLVIGGALKVETGATVEGLNGSGAGASTKVTAAALTADASGKITGGTLTLIESLILKAQAAAEDFCRTEFGEDNAPEPVRQAIVLLVSYYFQNRDVTDKQGWIANRMAFENLLYPHRDVSKMF